MIGKRKIIRKANKIYCRVVFKKMKRVESLLCPDEIGLEIKCSDTSNYRGTCKNCWNMARTKRCKNETN